MMRQYEGLMCRHDIRQELADFRKGPLLPKYKELVAFLYCHAGKKYPRKALEARLGLKEREIRACIRHARRNWHPVASSPAGYWIERDPVAIHDTVNTMKSLAMDLLETAHFMSKAATAHQHWSLWSKIVRNYESKQLSLPIQIEE